MKQDTLSGLAVVTGAGQGIGRAIALQLLQAGCCVQAIGRSQEKLGSLATEAKVPADQVFVSPVDIQDTAAVSQAITQAEAALGPVRYLVNAAGVLAPSRLLETSEDALLETISINLTATVLVTQIVAKRMADYRQGSIVTIGSNSGTTPRTGFGIYPASKAGVAHAMKCMALELAETGVRCNIVSPGSTDTPMQAAAQTDEVGRERVLNGDLSNWRLGIPLGRMAEPSDVADVVLFVLSDRARHITMENIVIDGGATLGAR